MLSTRLVERRNAAEALFGYYVDVDPNERKAAIYEQLAGDE